jgi:putative intracellular protease/amidase
MLEAAEAAGKVISAVCHGPVGLVNIKDSSGAPLVANKAVSSWRWLCWGIATGIQS